MRTGRPKTTLTISSDERTHLLAITRSRSLPAALTLRAKIVLACEREVQQRRRVDAAWRRPSYDRQMAQSLHRQSDPRGSTTRCVAAGPARLRMRQWPS